MSSFACRPWPFRHLFLAAVYFFSFAVTKTSAKCSLTLFSVDAEALAEALPAFENFQDALPGWDPTNVTEACCWQPYNKSTGSTLYLDCQKVDGIVRIVKLSLVLPEESVLEGILPPSIGNLSALTFLNLSGNYLSGSIPENWSNLSSISSLDLNGIGLDGTLEVISNFRALIFLDLSGNSFSGSIPESWSNLNSISSLDLNGIGLDGTLEVISNFKALTFLNLSGNSFSGSIPESWSNLNSISSLDLNSNGLNGTLEVISNFKALTFLDLSGNSFSGSIPESWSNLNLISSLNLNSNGLNGTLEVISNFTALTFLDLAGNQFSGSIPESWSNLNLISSLNLNGIGLNGTVEAISSFRILEILNVGGNSFSGEMDKLPFRNFKSLKEILLTTNNFTGKFPSWLGNLTNLTSLEMGNHNLSPSTLPTKASDWPKGLKKLSCKTCNLIGPIPGILANLPLEEINLGDNNLNGSIPSEFGNFNVTPLFTVLDLSSNTLTGEIPLELVNGYFFTLSVSKNAYDSNITSFLTALCSKNDAIYELDISDNRFTGSIPSEIAKCGFMGQLTFSNNRLSGTIPKELGNIASLQELVLDNNQLSGEIPTSFSELADVVQLTLSNNNFTGSLPDFNSPIEILLAENNSLSGPLPSSLANCPLNVVSLQSNFFNGSIGVFSNQPGMETLNLANNNFSGNIPVIIDWSKLTTVNLSSNSFTGTIPQNLGTKAQNLGVIDLSFNSLHGTVPSNLFTPGNLTILDLSYNNLNRSLGSRFLNSSSVTRVLLRGNRLLGPLPKNTFVYPKNLIELDLQNNSFSGSLPSNLSGASQLVKLNLANNAFSGALPSLVPIRALQNLNFSNNTISGSIPNLPTVLRVIDMSKNYLSESLPTFQGFDYLTYVDFSSNQLSGPIATNFSTVAKLTFLDFSQNNLSGTIPASYNNLTNLTYFNVSNNFLTGQIPINLENVSSFSNNLGLCGGLSLPACPNSPPPSVTSSSKNSGNSLSAGAIVGIALGGGILLLVILGTLWFVFARKVAKYPEEKDTEKSMDYSGPAEMSFTTSADGKFLIFQTLDFDLTIEDIVRATNNFSDECLLGRGGFGSVYRAEVAEDRVFAVKRLTRGGTQGDVQFEAEMKTLGSIRHKNLVTLTASYNDPISNECLLIYEFLPGGDLDMLLRKGVDWRTRLLVAHGVARGLKYLHHNCVPYIIHRDMKPGNILMNSEMQAHVADFGLAKMVDTKKTHISTKLLGTIGYLAPEYASKGQASTKSDVFAYGVVLLQLVSGKLPIDQKMQSGMSQWAKSSPVDDVIDPNLDGGGEYRKEILAVLKLGIACTARNPKDRPTMEEVLHTLDNLEEFGEGIKDD